MEAKSSSDINRGGRGGRKREWEVILKCLQEVHFVQI